MKRLFSVLLTLVLMCVLFAAVPMEADAQTLTSSDAFIEILKKREGFEKYPYKDNSQWSIGYGTRVPDGKLEYYQKNGITEAEAEKLMRQMLADFEASVLSFANKYNITLKQHQFDALVSFSYNCGDAWTKDTSGNMNRAVREGWTGSDFVYAICLWSNSAGNYILINRRMYEANMYLYGIYGSYDYDTGSFRYVLLDSGQGKTEYEIHGYDIRDPKPIRYNFKQIPTGIDAKGNTFTYEFAGWYTAPENGKLVTVLDSSITNESCLYAMWKDPSGKLVYLPKTCVTVKVNTDGVNVRSGPGAQYSKVGQLNKNATVKLQHVFGNKNLWGKYEGGWIKLSYTDYDDVIAGLETWPKTGVVNGDKVNVRSGPGTSNPKQYQLNKGDKVTISEQTYVGSMYWGKLADGNWISLTYVTFDPVTPAPKPEPEPEPNPEPQPETDPAGDLNGDSKTNEDDAIYLLRHVLMPEKYPINATVDYDKNGNVNEDDAIYLLRHVLMPGKYPLQ